MRLVKANDKVFENLMDEKSKIVYNLLFQIKNDSSAFIVTDDTSYIFAQDSKRTPNWIFINEEPSEETKEELIAVLSGMVKINPLLRVNGQERFILPILEEMSARFGIKFKAEIPMSVYFCNEVKRIAPRGHMISPKELHRERLKELISSMSKDADGLLLGADDSEKYISSLIHSRSFFLWEDEKIVSMAKIAGKNDSYARINTIFTDLSERGNGYTTMLVGEISAQLISDGFTPIIYADSSVESKIEAYKTIGFEKAGDITQFVLS